MADDRLTLKEALEEIARALGVSGGAAQQLLRDACSDYVPSYGVGLGVGPGGEISRQHWQDATLYVEQNAIATGVSGGIVLRHIKIDGNDLRHWLKERKAASASRPASVRQPQEAPRSNAMPPAKAARPHPKRKSIKDALHQLYPDGLPQGQKKQIQAQVERHLGLGVSRRTFGRAMGEFGAAPKK